MAMNGKDDESYRLVGDSNYLGWVRVAHARLAEKQCVSLTTDKAGKKDFIILAEHEATAYGILHRIISMKVLQSIPSKITTANGILKWLKTEFGSVDWYTRKQQWKNVKMTGLDPMPYFDAYNVAYANYLAAEGPDSLTDALDILLEGLDQKFYSDCIRLIRSSRRDKGHVDDDFVATARKTIKEYYADNPKPDVRNYSAANATNYSERRCTICVDANRPERVYRSHDTANHRVIAPRTNKGDKEYYHLFAETVLDTGANDHFFCDKPHEDYRSHSGTVCTADGGKTSIVGVGSITVGNLKLKRVLHVPKFKRNLVSGSRLMKDGFTLVAHKNHVNFAKNNKHICVAKLDPADGLVKFP